MKHSSTRELFEYWNARRGPQPAPERSDIEPGAIRRSLADTFILAYDTRAGHPFRIAGTRVCAAFGRELKGTAFLDLWTAESRTLVRDLLAVVAEETIGIVAGAHGANSEGVPLEFELLVLPLKHRGRIDARIIGALAPNERPYWLGISSLAPLSLGMLRYLGPSHTEAADPPHLPAIARGRNRHGLVVYDGGQS